MYWPVLSTNNVVSCLLENNFVLVFGMCRIVDVASNVFHEITADSPKPAFSFTRDERNIISLLAMLELNKIVYSLLNLS